LGQTPWERAEGKARIDQEDREKETRRVEGEREARISRAETGPRERAPSTDGPASFSHRPCFNTRPDIQLLTWVFISFLLKKVTSPFQVLLSVF
jgi:hypothetical protein